MLVPAAAYPVQGEVEQAAFLPSQVKEDRGNDFDPQTTGGE